MSTAAAVRSTDSSHWYWPDGRPAYEIAKKDGSGVRPTTLADARKMNLLPSVTTILRILDKPALTDWKIEQAVLAAMTTPRIDGEADDAFVYRALHRERHQDQESQIARDLGTGIHAAIENFLLSPHRVISPAGEMQSTRHYLGPWIFPALFSVLQRGSVLDVECCVIGDGYAGKLDLAQEAPDAIWLWDWKTAKKLPDPKKGAWPEHVLQLSAYARAWFSRSASKPIRTGNVYISTVEQGKFVICEHGPWEQAYSCGFMPLVQHWQWATGYKPKQ